MSRFSFFILKFFDFWSFLYEYRSSRDMGSSYCDVVWFERRMFRFVMRGLGFGLVFVVW